MTLKTLRANNNKVVRGVGRADKIVKNSTKFKYIKNLLKTKRLEQPTFLKFKAGNKFFMKMILIYYLLVIVKASLERLIT